MLEIELQMHLYHFVIIIKSFQSVGFNKWVIIESITFDYPVSVDLFKSVDVTSLHIPLSMLSMTSTPLENGEGFVFVVPPSKKNQSSIVFGRVQPRISAVTDSCLDSEPSQFFHYTLLAHHMMRKWGYDL